MSSSDGGPPGYRTLLFEIEKRMMQSRIEYENVVHQMYEEEKPFERHRPATVEDFEEELKILGEMVAHCIVLESSKILDMYAIFKIRENPRILASHHNMEAYISAFDEKRVASTSDGEKLYLQQLIDELRLIESQIPVGT
ncbi:hypothetical protein SPB21_34930 [Leptothoe sp. ISB3NOV94-8A]